MLGPTGSGKTHAALTLAALTRYSLVIATKRRDPLLSDLAARGYLIAHDLSRDVLWAGERPLHARVIFWPRPPAGKAGAAARLRAQAQAVRTALDWADRTGGWTVVIDELMWVARNLRLEREIESLYFQARTQGVSLVGAAQRPRQVPLLSLNQSTYLGIWQTSDRQDLERLRELSAGFPRGFIDRAVAQLAWSRHEVLWIDAKRREACRVVFPARIPAPAAERREG